MSDAWCEVVTREPVWLQEWREKFGTIVMANGSDRLALSNALDTGQGSEFVRLLVAAPALVRLVLRKESASEEGCLECCAGLGVHDAVCDTDEALTLAGFPDQASRDAARARMAK